MNFLFSPAGQKALAGLIRARPLLTFDFDGTLCALEREPDDSRTLVQNLPLMKALCRKVPVAIITGRSVRDIRGKLGFKPKYIVGNHGLEGLDHAASGRAAETVRAWRKVLESTWAPFARDPGVFIEDKKFSLSLHYRLGRNPAAARRQLHERIAQLNPAPRVIGGKFIFNLTLDGAAHKGTALLDLARRERARQTLFIGDDVTDEDAFGVTRSGLLKVRVGRSSRSAADYFVRDLDGVTRLLTWLNQNLI